MAELFVSYKSEDRSRVAPLVEALELDGVGIWWDAHIGGGAAWRDTIESELNAAQCVLVVWSRRSIGPDGAFVRDEATRALRRGVYLPIRIDPVDPPLGFGETQALPLIGWKGDRADPRYPALLAAVRATIAGKPRPAPPAFRAKRGVDRRLVLGGGAAALAVAGASGWWAIHRSTGTASDSVAVLPFENLSGDPAQAYFSDGIAEELRGALSRIVQLQVAARTSSELMRDADAKTAAAKLGVANIVTGSVRRGADTIRVDAQLVDGTTGLTRWSQTYDRAIGDALAIETGIAENVASALQIALGRAEKVLLSLGGTSNPVAHDAFLRGKALAAQNQVEALKEFDAAVAADPNFALAHSARAGATTFFASNSVGGAALRAKLDEAEAEARRAVALAPGLGDPLANLGFVLETRLDLHGAAAAYAAAYKASPGDAAVLRRIALFQSYLAAGEDALALNRRSQTLDPFRPNALLGLGVILISVGRFDEAIAALRAALVRLPGNATAIQVLCTALLATGQSSEAMKMVAPLAPNSFIRLTVEAIATAATDRAASDQALTTLSRLYSDSAQFQIAEVHAQRHEHDLAFAAIARAWELGDPGLIGLKTDPLLAPLRPDPRFAAWLHKIGFP